MNKCLRVTIFGPVRPSFLHDVVQQYAKNNHLEGVAQALGEQYKLIVCGKKDRIDAFVDFIQTALDEEAGRDIPLCEIEPFIKDKDYRGVFRIIE